MAIDLYLASASPRRKELLESMGLRIECCPANIEELRQAEEAPIKYVERLAVEKANAAVTLQENQHTQIPFLGADTIVVCEGGVFEKPRDKFDAIDMWQAMSGGQHQVLTAIAILGVINGELRKYTAISVSKVSLKVISRREMDDYWQSGEPQDKAGAYGIQDWLGLIGITQIKGSYTNVMGLPTHLVYKMLIAMVS